MNGEGKNGLAINGDGQFAVGQAEIADLVRGGGGLGIGFFFLDTIDKGKEVIAQINCGTRNDEGADVMLQQFIPSEDNIDFGKGENRGEGIVGGVKDQALNGGTLHGRGVRFRGRAKVNVGKKQGGGVSQTQRSGGNAGAKIIQLQGGVGDEEAVDVKGETFPGALGIFETTEPALGSIKTDLGEVSTKEGGVKADSDGFDPQSGAVLNAANFQLPDSAPTGGGKRGGEIGDKEQKVKRNGG